MASSNLHSLLKYRFTKGTVSKISNGTPASVSSREQASSVSGSGSSSDAVSSSSGLKSPPRNSSSQVSTVPDTPESQRPDPGSPVFPASKPVNRGSGNSSPSVNSRASTASSPWLNTNKPVQNGVSKLKTNKNRILSDSESDDPDSTTSYDKEAKFQENVRHLRSLFPTQSTEELEEAVRSTSDLDSAIDYAMERGNGKSKPNKVRKRIRTVSVGSSDSDSSVQQKTKKARPLSYSQSSSQEVTNDVIAEVDQAEGLTEKVEFLLGAFPKVPPKSLEHVLRRNNYDVEKSSFEISRGKFAIDGDANNDVTSSVYSGSIKAIQAERAEARKKKTNSHVNDIEELDGDDDGEEEVVSKQKKRARRAASDEGSLSSVDEDELDDEEYDSDDSESELMSHDQTKILTFFNTATIEEFQTMPGCSKKKADAMMDLRPFDSWPDLVQKVNESKTLSFSLISGCREMIRIRAAVLQLMQKCEKISKEMQQVVKELDETDITDGQGHITKQPDMLDEKLVLKPFQMVGLNWLMLMHRQDLNGILADEMGLGKTVQSISFLAQLTQEEEEGPHVIICPSSTLDNWLSELRRWCPKLKVSMYYGSQEERRDIRAGLMSGSDNCQVLVTTYNMATGGTDDRVFLKRMHFHYAIFDEAHMLKNMSSLRYQNLMKIRAERRILLTGTPLQNNLVELMSLLCFVMPRMFIGKTEHLKKLFSTITQKPKSKETRSKYEKEIITRAKNIMKPFVLRRLKSEVLQQLPQKLDFNEHCEMSFAQDELYTELKEKFQRNLKLNDKLKDPSIPSGAGMLMQLRKAANHHLLHRRVFDAEKLRKMSKLMLKEPTHMEANPDLIYEDMEVMSDFELHALCKNFKNISQFRLDQEDITDTGKFRYLDQILPDLKEKGDRVLLFSQFTMMLDIIEEYMKSRKHKYFRLDGQTAVVDRQELINKFNADSSVFVFLLSTRAGGLGINLTSANTVILHDIDFNPYNDKQAEDRCHRVGQTRDVTVYRLVSKNSVEEAMLKCAQEKLKLEQDITSKPTKSKKEDADEDIEDGDVAFLLREALI